MTMSRRVIMLWISDLTWELLDQMPAAAALCATGTAIRTLEPWPITGSKTQAYQALTGSNPGRIGYFDEWLPRGYTAQPATEADVPTLQQAVSRAGLTVTYQCLSITEVPAYLSNSVPVADYLIVRTSMTETIADANEAISAARTWAGDDGVCMVFSHHHRALVPTYVNLNDGLHSLGVLELSGHHSIEQINWEETLAYHLGHGQIWVNLEGREPQGIVAARDEYDQVARALADSLPAQLIDPDTGQGVIERVYRREELYHGDYLFQAPDLVVVFRPGYAPSPRSVMLGLDGTDFSSLPISAEVDTGLHPSSVAGLAVAAGPSVRAGGHIIDRALLAGIAPTFLYMLGLPIPASMDAQVITDWFDEAFVREFPVRQAMQDSDLSSEDEAEIMARLRTLGYVG